ncbi:MAG: T9SS type A sorting domain-containing protein [FCB group bacterium]|jgi:photosystem II stability/assembly factor-like uncharacterized protein
MKNILLLIIIFLINSTNIYSHWERCKSGLNADTINCISIYTNEIYVGTQSKGIYFSIDDDNNWTSNNDSLSNQTIWSISKLDNDIYASTIYGIFSSLDNGNSWSQKTFGGHDNWYNLVVLCGNYIIASLYEYGLMLSSDKGNTWLYKGDLYSAHYITAIGINGNDIFALSFFRGISFSSDCGETFVSKDSNIFLPLSIYINKDIIAIGTEKNGIYYSSDYGDSWISKNNGLSNLQINAVIIINDKIFAGTAGGGIFLSSDSCNSWSAQNDSLSNLNILSLAHNNKYIFAGTQGGLFRAKLSDFGITNVNDLSNEQNFSLFPNPVSDYLYLNIGNNNYTEIKIYNELGIPVFARTIQEINNLKIDTRDYSPGVYFCQIKAGSYTETRRFIVVK